MTSDSHHQPLKHKEKDGCFSLSETLQSREEAQHGLLGKKEVVNRKKQMRKRTQREGWRRLHTSRLMSRCSTVSHMKHFNLRNEDMNEVKASIPVQQAGNVQSGRLTMCGSWMLAKLLMSD